MSDDGMAAVSAPEELTEGRGLEKSGILPPKWGTGKLSWAEYNQRAANWPSIAAAPSFSA